MFSVGQAAFTVGGALFTVGGAMFTVGAAEFTVGGAVFTVGGAEFTVGGGREGYVRYMYFQRNIKELLLHFILKISSSGQVIK